MTNLDGSRAHAVTANLIEQALAQSRLTQRGLAYVLGVSLRSISGWRATKPPEPVRLLLEGIVRDDAGQEIADKIEDARRLYPDRRRRGPKP